MSGTVHLKPKCYCPCGCGKYGMPRKRAWRDGLRHVRACICNRCNAPRFKREASDREREIAADLGGTREPMSGALSGADVRAGLWSFEETADLSVVRGFRRWWTSKTVERKLARLRARHGEARALILTWDGRPRVVVVEYEDFVGQFPNQTGDVA